MPTIDMASKVYTNLHYPHGMVGGAKYDWIARKSGGHCAVAAPFLHHLGHRVNVFGRYTIDDEPLRRHFESLGINWQMQKVEGSGALNAILNDGGEPLILRVSGSAGPWTPTTKEGNTLSRSGAAAMAIGGSMDADYEGFFLETAAARGLPCFYNASAKAGFSRLGAGEVYLQVSHAELGAGPARPRERAIQLLMSTGAAGCVVTDSVRGSYGILRGDNAVLHAPAIALPADQVVRTVGAGDAFFSGFIVGMLSAPRATRLERGLHLGRLLAAWHITSSSRVSWSDLRRFEQEHALPQTDAIRVAA